MAIDNSTTGSIESGSFNSRLLAVLDYDGIPEQKRAAHLSKLCGMSISTARRILRDDREIEPPKNHRRLFEIAAGLKINWCWLHDGTFDRFDRRTALIQLTGLENYAIREAEMTVQLIDGEVPGEPKYIDIWRGKGLPMHSIIMMEQRRRMTAWEKNKHLRMQIRLANNDPKAQRLLDMAARGQITRQQLLGAM